jgi:hypothetical protein
MAFAPYEPKKLTPQHQLQTFEKEVLACLASKMSQFLLLGLFVLLDHSPQLSSIYIVTDVKLNKPLFAMSLNESTRKNILHHEPQLDVRWSRSADHSPNTIFGRRILDISPRGGICEGLVAHP